MISNIQGLKVKTMTDKDTAMRLLRSLLVADGAMAEKYTNKQAEAFIKAFRKVYENLSVDFVSDQEILDFTA